jgi:hypothetical protein
VASRIVLSSIELVSLVSYMGHAGAQWLRHYAAGRKIAGLKPDEVNEFVQVI